MTFTVNSIISADSHHILDWSLSAIYLKNNANFPWLILVPNVSNNITEMHQLEKKQCAALMDEITTLSACMKKYFKADKINVGMLGNIVPQLHIHVIARYQHDLMWPQSVWQANVPEKKYTLEEQEKLIADLSKLLTP